MEVRDGVTYYPDYETCRKLWQEAWDSAWAWVNLRFEIAEAMSRGRRLHDNMVAGMDVRGRSQNRKET